MLFILDDMTLSIFCNNIIWLTHNLTITLSWTTIRLLKIRRIITKDVLHWILIWVPGVWADAHVLRHDSVMTFLPTYFCDLPLVPILQRLPIGCISLCSIPILSWVNHSIVFDPWRVDTYGTKVSRIISYSRFLNSYLCSSLRPSFHLFKSSPLV